MAENNDSKDGMTRRKFIQNTGLVVGGALGGGLLGGLIGNQTGQSPETAENSAENNNGAESPSEARMFFKRQDDFNVLSAASEVIFPEDESGPGAVQLGVPYYIDKQLAGGYGRNAKEYMKGPFFEGEPTQGYQAALTRDNIFLQGIRRIQQISSSEFNTPFQDLEEENQIAILEEFESGNISMKGITSTQFFELLRSATLEGVYADPIYGGNRGMEGWKMKDYPGAQMTYTSIMEDEEFSEMDPVSLRDHHS
ncbi:gluconate 2-dehydrogenase subunit 3 family protein [Alkalicoccus halolimnae]|uniref:Gluconate 2-dehydrogenase subunit 3 family protein n=1 Tax=Alkalicoccus halolimnae TaxID=1667239 RepID=A0A5C7FJ59_9BACI|nr:gluconate 2-dehydrogenase subunit 3 family protein [Alkalicoccus halolimnae]TXF84586.1 gluconate 2-dehydrogenase subunit 3 family protein [Alkalicoccus halolimnae]